MWLSKAISKSNVEQQAEQGTVTMSNSNTLETESSVRSRSISTYAPYGYSSVAPVGEKVMLLNQGEGQAVIGTELKVSNLESGEVLITSLGGASIMLKNDGSVIINSLKINKDGVIEQ